jgi:hypothetical protein
MTFKSQWAGIGYGREKRAHFWHEGKDQHHARSRCGRDILAAHLKSAVGLERCKTCEKVEKRP